MAKNKRAKDHRVAKPGWRKLEDYDLMWAVVEPLWEKLDFYGSKEPVDAFFSNVAPENGAMIAIWWCTSEVCNGGFDQFFFNSTGMIWPYALSGFRHVGAKEHAALLKKALSWYPGSRPSLNNAIRRRKLQATSKKDRSKLFDPLDERFYALERTKTNSIYAICGGYIRKHPQAYFLD